jgi:hypothetical protein
MYLRETRRTNKDGTVVRYLQLAHNQRHPGSGVSTAKVIHNFGRADRVDREALRRLVASISRFLDPLEAPAAELGGLEVLDARHFGGAWVLDRIWERLGIGAALRRAAAERRLDGAATERVLFALVAQRALCPGSKLACCSWVEKHVAIEGLAGFEADAAYAAMDFLLEALEGVAAEIFAATATLLNLALDVVFLDTTTTYFETDLADELAELAQAQDAAQEVGALAGLDDASRGPAQAGLRRFSKHSKDKRPDLPQVVIGMAVTAEGVPVRCWTFPGNTSDQRIIRTVKDDLAGWGLRRVVWVADRGFNSLANRAYLTRAGGHYVVAERLRGAAGDAQAALERAGRYRTVAGNLRIKEVHLGSGTRAPRFVVAHNPEQAARDAAVRANLLGYLEGVIAGSDAWSHRERDELVGSLRDRPGLRRYLRRTKEGKLRIDRAAVERERKLDGKWLLRTSDETLAAEDLAAAYRQLVAVERGWRDMKGALRLRPVFHHREDRIRSHVQLCWLALLLMRVVENAGGDTWRNIRDELERMHLVSLASKDGSVAQRSLTTPAQRAILTSLELPEPPRFADFSPSA